MNAGSEPQKLLFVCSRNKRRSLTAERLFEGAPGYEARSVGTRPGARIVITPGHIGWSDLIFAMEKSHAQKMRQRFPRLCEGKRLIILHIADDFEYMQPELLEELRCKLEPYVEVPGNS